MLLARHVMLLAFLCAFESLTAFEIRNDVNNSNDAGDSNKLRDLANTVISTLRSLKEGKSGADAKTAFQDIVQLAGDLLEGTELGGHEVPETTTVKNATIDVKVAVKLNGELALLGQHAQHLLKAIDERNEEGILLSVITIEQRASSIISIIDDAGKSLWS